MPVEEEKRIVAMRAYIKLLKYDDLSPNELAIARDAFTEGWLQCQRENINEKFSRI